MLCLEIAKYIETPKGLPFFYVVGDTEYMDVLNELKQNGLSVVRASRFCHSNDRFPDVDEMIDYFRTLDINFKDNKFVVIGLGEYLALRGSEDAKQILRRLKSVTLGSARVVILLRAVARQVKDIVLEDNRIVSRKLVYISEETFTNISITNNKFLSVEENNQGIKQLLFKLEEGVTGCIEMHSELNYANSILPVATLDRAFTALSRMYSDLLRVETCGKDEQWMMLLDKVSKNSDYLQRNLACYLNFEGEIQEYVIGEGYKNWLYFLNLKLHRDKIQNEYLSYVVGLTDDAEELKHNILIEITKIPHVDRRYKRLYAARKSLIKNFPESDIAVFVAENKVNPDEEIYGYTDNTNLEKEQIISWIAEHGWNNIIAEIYPDLGMYMKQYHFHCGSVSMQLTKYFDLYKKQKIENCIYDDFMQLVYQYGKNYLYTKLQTKDVAINKIEGKESTMLYWIDALGVEYLSYITELARRKGLSIHIDVARADLPTITSINKSFYDNWMGLKKYKEEELDDTKHKKKGGYFYTKEKKPIYIVKELEVIKRAIECAKTSLAMHECRQFVIVSDHGASRLAVLKKDENPHPTDTQGEHSGRCCKAYDEGDREYIIEENGYFVRTDYGRYKGSREANVEVHGGASLEEIIVPVITLRLKKQMEVDVRVLNADSIQADRHNGTSIDLYISDIVSSDKVAVVVDGVKYQAKCKDKTHYSVVLTDVKRQKECRADVYDGDDLIGTKDLSIKGKTASVNSDFDDLF